MDGIVYSNAQWGDEGKGKIVDYLAQDAKYVCRFAGGANAGHTIVVDGKKYALHQVPSGILYPNKTVFLGSGMVIEPEALFNELKMLTENGALSEQQVVESELHIPRKLNVTVFVLLIWIGMKSGTILMMQIKNS